MSDSRCHDCGERHESGLDALACDWRLGGEDRVRRNLRRLGVADTVADAVVSQLRGTPVVLDLPDPSIVRRY